MGRLANEHRRGCVPTTGSATVSTSGVPPAWHDLMSVRSGMACTRHPARRQPGAHVARRRLLRLGQADAGHCCPVSMTYSSSRR